jgi:hypothetical protein
MRNIDGRWSQISEGGSEEQETDDRIEKQRTADYRGVLKQVARNAVNDVARRALRVEKDSLVDLSTTEPTEQVVPHLMHDDPRHGEDDTQACHDSTSDDAVYHHCASEPRCYNRWR